MLRVAIDGRALYNQHSRDRGIGRYLVGLLGGLGRLPEIDAKVLATPGTSLPDGVGRADVRRLAPGSLPLLHHAADRLSLWEHARRLQGDIARSGADVFHSPATDPPVECDLPWVQTLHDLVPIAYPGADPATAERWSQRMAPVARADAVVADSRHTADDGIRLLGLDPGRVHVVHPGVSPMFAPAATPSVGDVPYVLYVGQWGPNKGYREAFDVIGRLAAAGRPEVLKVAGRVMPAVRPVVEALVAGSASPERVELLGHVPDPGLVRLYQGARAVLVTSRFEGFGYPALEAMACGTPVVAFDNTSTPEVVGDGGWLVEDGDVAAMTDAVIQLLDDPEAWSARSAAGLRRARDFSWQTSASRHAEVYASL